MRSRRQAIVTQGWTTRLLRVDGKSGTPSMIDLGAGRVAGEWVMVPRHPDAAEDDGSVAKPATGRHKNPVGWAYPERVILRAWQPPRLGWLALAAVAMATAACGSGASAAAGARAIERAAVTTTTTTLATTTLPPETTSTTATSVDPSAPTTTRPHPTRTVTEQAWVQYATVGPVTLHHPSDRVEAIGFHQSGHDGAQHQAAVAGAARWFLQEDRDRDTDLQGAADIVIEPGREVRSPVTGTVIRAGTYTLYCDKVDQYAVIEPDARPGWEVKVLHVEGLALAKGQRVEAGVTHLAARARVLPFASTVEDDTALPAWPHVHIEVVDPSIKDRPTGKGCG